MTTSRNRWDIYESICDRIDSIKWYISEINLILAAKEDITIIIPGTSGGCGISKFRKFLLSCDVNLLEHSRQKLILLLSEKYKELKKNKPIDLIEKTPYYNVKKPYYLCT